VKLIKYSSKKIGMLNLINFISFKIKYEIVIIFWWVCSQYNDSQYNDSQENVATILFLNGKSSQGWKCFTYIMETFS
jgi:hypothetical protein